MNLHSPITILPGVGPALAKRLNKLDINSVGDLLWHFPSKYEDFSVIAPISSVKLNEKSCVAGKILEIETSRTLKRKLSITQALIEDQSGTIKAVWFNQPYLSKTLNQDDFIYLAGKVALGKNGLYFSSPAYEKTSSEDLANLKHTGRLVPIYPETIGLSSRWMRYILKPIIDNFKRQLIEALPDKVLKTHNLMPIQQAIQQAHFPDSIAKAEKAKARFAFEELFLVELAVLRERLKINRHKAPMMPLNIELIKKFTSSLPFKLTNSQRKCAWQILKDLEKPMPMSRLLEGDVGSGKTVIAVIACLNTVRAGFQAAFMAPTEILAKQHFAEVSKLLVPFKIRIALLTGKDDKIISQKLGAKTQNGFLPEIIEISKEKILEKSKNGEIDILIGTHSLIQDKVKFGNLGLAVIDEQHRFGIQQRAKLIQDSKRKAQDLGIPHLLSMTATPIPRTLALTVFGDLDLSLLDEMPKGRKKIITKIIAPSQRQETYDFIRKQVKKGDQCFVICPRIDSGKSEIKNPKSETILNYQNSNYQKMAWTEAKAVKEEYEKLSKKIFPDLKVAMLHGKMKPKEKEKIMKDFKNQKTGILVSTSVVEVGVDIPKATIMMIEGAERFGLAQLHQFRGRVGRNDLQSYCFLLTDSPAKKTRQRLLALVKSNNGFELAQKDLDIRGPGSLYGAKQWGMPDLAMQNLTNLTLVETTRETAKEILQESPDLKKYPALLGRVGHFEKKIHME